MLPSWHGACGGAGEDAHKQNMCLRLGQRKGAYDGVTHKVCSRAGNVNPSERFDSIPGQTSRYTAQSLYCVLLHMDRLTPHGILFLGARHPSRFLAS